MRTSTLEFTTLINVESTFSILAMIGTRLDNVKTTFSFSTSKQLCGNDYLLKIKKQTLSQNNAFEFQIKIIEIEFTELKIFFTLFSISRDICDALRDVVPFVQF